MILLGIKSEIWTIHDDAYLDCFVIVQFKVKSAPNTNFMIQVFTGFHKQVCEYLAA